MFDFLFRHISVPKRQSDYKFSVWIIICTEKYLQIIRAAIGMTLLSFRTFSIHIDVMVFDIWPAHFEAFTVDFVILWSEPVSGIV